jgi:NitT/TauT family transport system substrate-binding protein
VSAWKRSSAAVAAGACLLLAACSSSGGKPDASTSGGSGSNVAGGKTTTVTVGTSTTLSNASLYEAGDAGLFTAQGLAVKYQVITSGAQAVPLLLNGQIQFTATDILSAIVAISNKVPLVIVGQGNIAASDPSKDLTGLVAKPDSGIKTLTDLAGKTVAVNSLNSLSQVSLQAAIDKAGGDSSKVKFVELPVPQMAASVEAGSVDAAVVNEPFVTSSIDAGLKVVAPVFSSSVPGIPQLSYVASKSYVSSHRGVVDAFAKGLDNGNKKLASDPAEIRTIGVKSTGTSPAVLAKVILPVFPSQPIQIGPITQLMNLMVKYHVLKAPIDVSSYIFQP